MSRYTLENSRSFLGEEVGVSEWQMVTQADIDAFAQATGDHQWIHTDVERSASGPFGTTIAHGLLTLSLTYQLVSSAGLLPEGSSMCVNYGYNRVRFPTPVRANQRIRCRVRLKDIQQRAPNELLLTHEYEVEVEGQAKPALVCDCLGLFYTEA
jgi:acyl dehydratase